MSVSEREQLTAEEASQIMGGQLSVACGVENLSVISWER